MQSRPTIRVVAEEANVSIATVSRVINNIGTVTDENKEKVIEAIKKVKYYSNTTASNLKRNSSNVVGVVIPTLTNNYFMEVIKGIEDQFQNEDYILYIVSSNDSPKHERRILQKLFENNTEVLIIATSGGNEDFIQELAAMGQKIISIDRRILQSDKFCFVGEDNYNNSYELANKFISEFPMEKVVVVGGLLNLSVGKKRKHGAEKAISDLKLESIFIDGGFTSEGGKRAMKEILQKFPDGCRIISLNNAMTSGMIDYIYSEVPEEKRSEILISSYGRINLQGLFKSNIVYFVEQYPYQIGVETAKILQKNKNTNEVLEGKKYVKASILKEE